MKQGYYSVVGAVVVVLIYDGWEGKEMGVEFSRLVVASSVFMRTLWARHFILWMELGTIRSMFFARRLALSSFSFCVRTASREMQRVH